MKKPKHRAFDYTPRFYNPNRDDNERIKRKLGFSSQRRKLKQKRKPLIWMLLIILVVYIYFKLIRVM